MDELFSVKGKVVAITGGAGVLCGVIARDLARRGAKICAIDYDVMRANELCQEIESEGGFALPVQANVLERKTIEEAFFCAQESFGQIDVLINGAATGGPEGPPRGIPPEPIRSSFPGQAKIQDSTAVRLPKTNAHPGHTQAVNAFTHMSCLLQKLVA